MESLKKYSPLIRITSPLQSNAFIEFASSASTPTLNAIHGSSCPAATAGSFTPLPTVVSIPQGWSGQSWKNQWSILTIVLLHETSLYYIRNWWLVFVIILPAIEHNHILLLDEHKLSSWKSKKDDRILMLVFNNNKI